MLTRKKIKVLHLNDKIEISGGVETNISHLCQYSSRYDIETEWLGIYKEKYFVIRNFQNPSKILFKGDIKTLLDYLTQYIEEASIDIIHIHSLSAPKIIDHCFNLAPVVRSMREPRMFCPGQGKFWRKSERICTVPFGLHCIYHAYKEGCCNRHPKRLIKAYNNVKFEVNEGAENYSAIFVMSNYMYDESIKVGFKSNTLILNPHFTPFVNQKDVLDKSNDNIKSLIFVGRLSRTKGVHYFIQAGLRLLKEGYKIQLDIVGDGHDANYFKSLVPETYKDQFIFHGWQSREQIDDLLHQSYLMVFPSIYPEAFGISGIEAMMRAKPVVGFDVGGVSTWLKDNETGFLVEPKNVNDLAKHMTILLKDKETYKNFATKARTIAQKEFSVEKHMSVLRDTYQNLLQP